MSTKIAKPPRKTNDGNPIRSVLRQGSMNATEMRLLAERGVPVEEFSDFASRLGVSGATLAEALGMTVSTLTRRKDSGRLSPEESDRLAGAAQIYHKALRLYGDRAPAAVAWMTAPCPALDGYTPLSCARLALKKEAATDLLEGALRGEFYF